MQFLCLLTKWADKKKGQICVSLSAHFPAVSFCIDVPNMSLSLLTPREHGTPACSELNFTPHINKQIKQKSP